jgi:hypothetical protein
MKKQSVVLTFVLFAMFAAAIWYLYGNRIKTNGDPWKMLPATPSFVIEVNRPGEVLSELNGNPVWESLNNTLLFKRVSLRIIQLDSLLEQKPEILESIKNNRLLIAFYNNKQQGLSVLFVSKFKQNPSPGFIQHYLQNYLGQRYGVIVKPYGKFNLFTVADLSHDIKYHFTVMDGVLAFSMDENAVKRTIDSYRNHKSLLAESIHLEYLRKTAGKKASASIYINYNSLSATLQHVANSKAANNLSFFKTFGSWTETDLIIKNKELLFTGYTVGIDGMFLKNFAPVGNSNEIYNVLPFNAGFVLSLNGLNTTKRYKGKYEAQVEKIAPALKNGITLFSNAASLKEYKSKLYLLIKSDEDKRLVKEFVALSELSGGKYKTVYSGKYKIRKIDAGGFWGELLGEAFSGITGNYFTEVSDFIVFANTSNSLKTLIDYYETGKTMDLNSNFKSLSDNLQSNSNITLLLKPGLMAGILSRYLSDGVAKDILNNLETVDDFQNILFQFTVEGDNRFYNNFYVQFNKSFQEENLSLWKTVVNDKIVGKPYLVKNFRTGKNDIIVFDRSHYMYLINANGKILWKKKLVQTPMSDIEQVDYYKNGKIQFLFNTEDNIYIIDRKGRFTGNYPVRLNPSATNGLTLFDYNRRKDYRIMIAQADKRIYDYNIKGDMVKGWSKPKMKNIVTGKIQRLVINNKDYIFVTDIDNNVRILNRRGNTRIRLKGKVNKASNSLFYANKTNGKGIILTTDKEGRLTYISSSGKISHTVFGKFSPEHFFLYEDFDGNGRKDFIYVDNNRLEIFDRFKNLLFSYTFKSTITSKPQFFTVGKGKRILGVTASEEKTIYLFDKNGNTLISRGLVGEIPFTVGSLNNNNREINLITATGNVLYNYRLK